MQRGTVQQLVACCLPGGAITDVEQDAMQELLLDAVSDAEHKKLPIKPIFRQNFLDVDAMRNEVELLQRMLRLMTAWSKC